MLNKTITLEKEKILRLSRGKTEMTIEEIIELQHVPAEDKLWLLLKEEIIPARTLHEFALWCAETALTRANATDERSWNALKVKRLWLDGKATDEELAAARDAAMYAAWEGLDAARDAAMYTAWDVDGVAARYAAMYAAKYAAWAAAWDAARDAVWDAAWYAARYAAWDVAGTVDGDAARDEQLAKLKEMLGGIGQ